MAAANFNGCADDKKTSVDLLNAKSYYVAHALFTWEIENLELMPEDEKKYLISPPFQIDSIPAMWYLTFSPYYNMKDIKHAKFSFVKRDLKVQTALSVTYRIGVNLSGVNTWFEEKRINILRVKDCSSTVIKIKDFFSSDDDFRQSKITVLCEIYISRIVKEESSSAKLLDCKTTDLLRLSSDMSRLNGKNSDVIIKARHVTLYCHKAILSCRSPVFAHMLGEGKSYLKLEDEDYDHITNILTYIYSGTLPHDAHKRPLCIGLYECAERYSVNGLKELLMPTKIWGHTSINVEEINFTWTIEKFSSLPVKTNECMLSPVFGNGSRLVSLWYLELYPKGRLETPDTIGIFLKNSTLRDALHSRIQISILDKNMEACYTKSVEKTCMATDIYRFPKFLDKMKLDEYLLNGQLILNFQIKIRIPSSFLNKTSLICFSSTGERGLERFSKDLEKLLSNKIHHDVTVVVDDGIIKLHKFMLISRSPVLARLIKECREDECVIGTTDFSANIFEKVVYYIYTGKVQTLTTQAAIQLYEAAKYYEVEGLADRCLQFLVIFLDAKYFLDIYRLADEHKNKIFMTSCFKFFKCNQEAILSSVDWGNSRISKSDLISKFLAFDKSESHDDE